MDGKFLDFPLCCLTYINGDPQRLIDIAHYCIYERALKIDEDYISSGRINATDYPFVKAEDFLPEAPLHQKIGIAAEDLGIQVTSIDLTMQSWYNVKSFVLEFEKKYNTDAYCRMGRQLTYEVIEGKFPIRLYTVLSAIHSVLGKRNPFLRITYERIAYCSMGFKRKDIFIKEMGLLRPLTDKQLKTCIDKLREKNLIRVYVHSRREKYYSTRIKYEDTLRELVAKKKLHKAERMYNVKDREMSADIKRQIKRIRKTGKPNTMFLNVSE